MFTIRFKGRRSTRNPEMVKLSLIFYKRDYARVEKAFYITGFYADWDGKRNLFNENSPENIRKNKQLRQELLRYLSVAESWEAKGRNWIPVELSHYFDGRTFARNKSTSVSAMIDKIIERFMVQERSKNGKVFTSESTAELYGFLKRSLEKFTESKYGRRLSKYRFCEITEKFLLDYCVHEKQQGARRGNAGGVTIKLSLFYAVCIAAKKESIYGVDTEAFAVVKRKLHPRPVIPRTVSHDIIRRIEEFDRALLTKTERLHLDLFLFSYYAGGMSPIDVCLLRHDNIKGDTIIYERMKCDNIVRVILIDKAVDLIEKYRPKSKHDYVFPVLLRKYAIQRHLYDRIKYTTLFVNKTLKKICAESDIDERVTWYSARGSFISKMIDEGYHPLQIAQQTGNSPSTIYRHYYAITNRQEMKEKMNRVL